MWVNVKLSFMTWYVYYFILNSYFWRKGRSSLFECFVIRTTFTTLLAKIESQIFTTLEKKEERQLSNTKSTIKQRQPDRQYVKLSHMSPIQTHTVSERADMSKVVARIWTQLVAVYDLFFIQMMKHLDDTQRNHFHHFIW